MFLAHSVKEMILEHLNYDLDDRLYMLILFVPMLFVTQVRLKISEPNELYLILIYKSNLLQIRSLKYILPLSSIANALLVLTFSIMLYYLFKAELIFKDKALTPRTISGLPEFYGWENLSCIGTSISYYTWSNTIFPSESQYLLWLA